MSEQNENKRINLSSLSKTIKFMKSAQLESCYLFGGSTTINKTRKSFEVSDYDISVSSIEQYQKAITKLAENGWSVEKKGNNALSKNAAVIYPPKEVLPQDEYDFQYNQSVENKCIFNLESFYIAINKKDNDYQYEFVDPHDSLKDFETGKLRLLAGREREDEFNILKRFIVLSAKYDLPMARDSVNKDIIEYMDDRFSFQRENTPDHLEAKGACLDKFLKVVQRAEAPSSFLFKLAKSNVLKKSFPEIHKTINSCNFHKEIREKDDYSTISLLNTLYNCSENQDELIKELTPLKSRTKAKVPLEVLRFLNSHQSQHQPLLKVSDGRP
ncbi:MAG: hypothetical protein R3Y43_06425 [Alphaproteobacteria bacterium]